MKNISISKHRKKPLKSIVSLVSFEDGTIIHSVGNAYMTRSGLIEYISRVSLKCCIYLSREILKEKTNDELVTICKNLECHKNYLAPIRSL